MPRQKVLIAASLITFVLVLSFDYKSYTNNSEEDDNGINKTSPTFSVVTQTTPHTSIPPKNPDSDGPSAESNSANGSIQTIRNITPAKPNKLGAVSNSLQSLCMFAYQEPWIYFSAKLDDYFGLYRSMPDRETGIIKLDNVQAQFINVVDNWIYYFDKGIKKIYKISINGLNKSELADGNIISMVVYGDWIYYSKITQDGFGIYRMKTDGSNTSFITLGDRFAISDDGKWICFQRYDTKSEKYSFYVAGPDGSDEVKIGDYGSQIFQMHDGWIYAVINSELDSNLVRLKSDGSEMKILDNANIQSFVILDEWIYVLENYNQLYKIKTDGTEKTLLFSAPNTVRLAAVNAVQDWLYLIPMEGSSIMRLKNDGTDHSHVLE